jgi:thioredoxin reductase
MNNELYVDHLVIGLSISGIAAAIELASQGRSVCIVEHWPDTASLTGSAFIFSTPLNQGKLGGEEFEEIALRVLYQSKVIVSRGLLTPLCLKDNNNTFFYFFDEITQKSVFAMSVIFAPNGTEIGLPDQLAVKSFLGKGVSHDAWSDGLFFAGKPVTVVGCGNRAIEQAYWAAKWATSVSLICENDTLEASTPWMEMLFNLKMVKIRVGVQLKSIIADDAGNVKSVMLLEQGRDCEEETSAVFVARGLICCWSLWGEKWVIEQYRNDQSLYLSGLANGIDYSNHAQLFEDGRRAAKECLQSIVR